MFGIITSVLFKKFIEFLFWDNKSIRKRVVYMTISAGILLIASSSQGGVAKMVRRISTRCTLCRSMGRSKGDLLSLEIV